MELRPQQNQEKEEAGKSMQKSIHLRNSEKTLLSSTNLLKERSFKVSE